MGFIWHSLKHLAGTEMQSNDQSQPTSYKHTDHYIDLEQSYKAIGIIKLPNSLTPPSPPPMNFKLDRTYRIMVR